MDEVLYEDMCGVDEVGRGCLFGPVVACACVMPEGQVIPGIKDSKKLSKKKREAFDILIKEEALAIGFGQIGPDEIDRINIKEATRLAMKEAVQNLKTVDGRIYVPEKVYVDAEVLDIQVAQEKVIHGDDLIYAISCASILAKVYRDSLFEDYDQAYPGYDLINNVGYGTKKHYDGLNALGYTPLHRKTFLRKWMDRHGRR